MSGCRARQYNDQMQCPCGLAWDVNDPDPPQCREKKLEEDRRKVMMRRRIEEHQEYLRK